jgi:hypothetical protein
LRLLKKTSSVKKIFISTIITILILSYQKSQAQTSRDTENFEFKSQQTASKKKKKKGLFTKKYNSKLNNAVEEFDDLMKANVKKRAKIARKMEKPQYSDPTYFGHKRPPKKRAVGKRKMCKECGIVH